MSVVRNRQKTLQGAKTERSSSLNTLSSAPTMAKIKLPLALNPSTFPVDVSPTSPVCLFRCCLFVFHGPAFQGEENKAHFHTLSDNQPQAQISFTHLTVKILLKSFLNTHLICADSPWVMRQLTLPALADPSPDHHGPAAFPEVPPLSHLWEQPFYTSHPAIKTPAN